MYDFVINRDGTLRLRGGDIVAATKSTHINQKLYRALMLMPPGVLAGAKGSDLLSTETAIRDFLLLHFMGDQEVDPSKIVVLLSGVQGSDIVVKLSYEMVSDGASAESTSMESALSMEGGVVRSVDRAPSWLSTYRTESSRLINHVVSIDTPTSRIPLPVTPALSESGLSSVISLRQAYVTGDIVTRDVQFSFTMLGSRRRYILSRYLTGYLEAHDSILYIDLDVYPDDLQRIDEYGDVVYVSNMGGDISGTATLAETMMITRTVVVEQPESYSPVFPLRPARGIFTAVFPRTVPRGEYMIQYTGLQGV